MVVNLITALTKCCPTPWPAEDKLGISWSVMHRVFLSTESASAYAPIVIHITHRSVWISFSAFFAGIALERLRGPKIQGCGEGEQYQLALGNRLSRDCLRQSGCGNCDLLPRRQTSKGSGSVRKAAEVWIKEGSDVQWLSIAGRSSHQLMAAALRKRSIAVGEALRAFSQHSAWEVVSG